jgi:hypothetical protein
MQKTICMLAIIIFGQVVTFAQAVTRDDHRDLVERTQGLNTTMFLASLEKGNIDEAIDLIAPAFLKRKIRYRDSLTAYHKELSEVAGKTKLSIVVVTPDKNYNTYRCIYHNKKGDHFYMDLYYNKGQSNSKIARIRRLPVKETTSEPKTKATTKKSTAKPGSTKSTKTTGTKNRRTAR